MATTVFSRRGPVALLVAAACATAANADASTRKPAAASPNWAGYVATPLASPSDVFTRATGTWKEPRVSCAPGDAGAAAAIWVGIGGYGGSTELQQVGSTVGCGRHDRPVSTLWFDLYPYPLHAISLKARPGDTLTAEVTVSRTAVGLELTDLTRHWHFARTISWLTSASSSAEWIVEAPYECGLSTCAQARLADFGSLTFTQIGAEASTSNGTLRCPSWTSTPVQLNPGLPSSPPPTGDTPRSESAVSPSTPAAFASALDVSGSTFTVTWLPDMAALPPPVANS